MAIFDEENSIRDGDANGLPKEEIFADGVLRVDTSDEDLLRVINMKVRQSEDFFTKLNIKERRKKTNDYWAGKQIDRKLLYDWQVPYVDNVIYRDVETIVPIAVSKIPDIIVLPAGKDPEKRQRAKNLQKVLDYQIKGNYIRSLLRKVVRHSLLDFVSIIKCRWDRVRQKHIFEAVHPDNLVLDPTGQAPDFGLTSEGFEFIGEWIEEPLAVVIAKFPSKKTEILGNARVVQGNARQMASKIRYLEVWYTWYDKDGMPYEGVCWKYQNTILGKMRNPYFDYEGEKKMTSVDPFTGEANYETLTYNYFPRPVKPYIVLNYQSSGSDGPVDNTNPVEQSIPLQDIVNKRGRQITELADKANPKKVFSDSFISKDDAAEITDDPNESIWGTGDVRAGFDIIPGVPPQPQLYEDLMMNRTEMDNILGAHSTTRGERVPSESGISKQISREGDFGRIDDLVFTVVERAADEMAQWSVHMLKVFGVEENFTQVLGPTGKAEFAEFDRDSIDDGINITVKASTVDKTERRAVATQLSSSGMIDPLSMFEDLSAGDPEERAKRLAIFKGDPTGLAYLQLILGNEPGVETPDVNQTALPGEPVLTPGGENPVVPSFGSNALPPAPLPTPSEPVE